MNKENVLLILWIIFGFIFISGIDSILYFITYLIYFTESELGLSYGFMKYSMPIITLILYVLTTFMILKKLMLYSNSSGIYLTKFPKIMFVVLALSSLTLNPITQKLSSLYAKHSDRMENIEISDFLQVYGWMTSGIYFSRWLILITLSILFIKKLKVIENKN